MLRPSPNDGTPRLPNDDDYDDDDGIEQALNVVECLTTDRLYRFTY